MGIEKFPLAWRWTQESHAILPQEVLASMVPLQPNVTDRLYNLGEELSPRSSVVLVTHEASKDSAGTRVWLTALPIPLSTRVLVVWNRVTGLALPWQAFVRYWDDFCYPSSDDVFVFPEAGTCVLAWNHYEVFDLIENVPLSAAKRIQEEIASSSE